MKLGPAWKQKADATEINLRRRVVACQQQHKAASQQDFVRTQGWTLIIPLRNTVTHTYQTKVNILPSLEATDWKYQDSKCDRKKKSKP